MMTANEVLDLIEYNIRDGLPIGDVLDALIHIQAGVCRLLNAELNLWAQPAFEPGLPNRPLGSGVAMYVEMAKFEGR